MEAQIRILEVVDIRKQGSDVEVGAVVTAQVDLISNTARYKDAARVSWIFYIGDTCELVNSNT